MVKCLICILASIPTSVNTQGRTKSSQLRGVMNEKDKKPHSGDSWVLVATQKNKRDSSQSCPQTGLSGAFCTVWALLARVFFHAEG